MYFQCTEIMHGLLCIALKRIRCAFCKNYKINTDNNKNTHLKPWKITHYIGFIHFAISYFTTKTRDNDVVGYNVWRALDAETVVPHCFNNIMLHHSLSRTLHTKWMPTNEVPHRAIRTRNRPNTAQAFLCFWQYCWWWLFKQHSRCLVKALQSTCWTTCAVVMSAAMKAVVVRGKCLRLCT